MEVFPSPALQYAEESNSPKHEQVQEGNSKVDNFEINMEAYDDEQFGDGDWKHDESFTLEGHPNDDSYHEFKVDDQKLTFNTRDSEFDSLDADTIEREPARGNHECEFSHSEPKWLEQDQPMAVWVKWRGKWQAGIRCARSDWPLSTLRAKPTHGRKQYLVIFFPRTRNYSWADVLLVRPINEFPEPIAYRSHNVGVKMVKDLTLARRFIMQKLAVSMINTIEQLQAEALIETARNMIAWKDFSLEASRCKGYSDLGRMLLKLENMILQRYLNTYWLEHSLQSWEQQCQNAHSAESIEILKEELGDAINWNVVHTLSNAEVQHELGFEWKTWKPEVMKWFSMSNPSFNNGDVENQSNDGLSNMQLHVRSKRPKLEVRRAEVHTPQPETRECSNPSLPVIIDSKFFDGQTNPLLGMTTERVDYASNNATDRWAEIVVDTGNTQENRLKDFEANKVNKNRQCTAFIKAKGRQCVRWANDGDVYCCVHLASRFSANSAKSEVTPCSADAQMCEGTTVVGTKCKHRSLRGSSFCKKHRPHQEAEKILTFSSENNLERRLETLLQMDKNTSLIQVTEQSRKENNGTESVQCIGDNVRCNETPKRHSLYCDKHLPNWLKRARDGKSRIVSKEVFTDLLKSCQSQEQKLHLHKACELFYKFFKSVLSLRNPVPKEIQLQWAISEASKDLGAGNFLMKLVCSEKERLLRLWGFNKDDNVENSFFVEEPVEVLTTNYSCHDNGSIIKCNICSETFSDDQMLGKHWIDNHKHESRRLFRGYVCAICLDAFTSKKRLEAHVHQRHHVQFVEQCMLYQCIPCGSHFGNPDQLWLHVLSNHPANFRLQSVFLPHGDEASRKFEIGPYYTYNMKSGRLTRQKFKRGLGAVSYKMRNQGTGSIKKRIQAPVGEVVDRESHLPETANLTGSQCSDLATLLFSEIKKTKARPGNLEILSLARSACCKVRFQASLEKKYGVLPERLYLKAAKLCSERNIMLEWHQHGFLCPYGCTPVSDSHHSSPLVSLSDGSVRRVTDIGPPVSVTSEWAMDECHYVINFKQCRDEAAEMAIILCDDISFGKESVPIVCVVDEHFLGSLSGFANEDDGQSNGYSMPWESFTYVMKPLLDPCLDLGPQSLQLGCGCAHSTCSPKACDHVYLFDNDYEDAKDIHGQPMKGRLPYDEKSRIILEEGYLVYECNNSCTCSQNCTNRVLQNGVRVKLEVFRTEKKGWAVRAGEPILRGTFVCEYIGEVIDEHEANKRRRRYGREGCGSYVYEIDARVNDMSRLIEGEASYAIDATKYGNVSRFVNHSCSPNLENHQVLIESMDSQLSHIGLYASHDIAVGEELTYDYTHISLPGERWQCQCGASNCRSRG